MIESSTKTSSSGSGIELHEALKVVILKGLDGLDNCPFVEIEPRYWCGERDGAHYYCHHPDKNVDGRNSKSGECCRDSQYFYDCPIRLKSVLFKVECDEWKEQNE